MNIRDSYQRISHPWGFLFCTLMLLLLGLASCAGCGQKTPPAPVPTTETPPAPAPAPAESEGDPAPLADADATRQTPSPAPASPLYKDPNFPGISLRPWHPVVIPPAVEERERASYQLYKAKEISIDEHLDNMYQLYKEHLDAVSFIRELAPRGGPYAGKYEHYLEKLLAENPNDFETLYTWAEIGGKELERPMYGPEKTAAYRRLYEMNPTHPMVLHRLAQGIFPTQPAEALGYAQQAQQLEPRLIPQGLDGVCYYQMGDYEQALAAFRRAHAAAPEVAKPAAAKRIQRVLQSINSPKRQATQQRRRDLGLPLMGRSLFLGRHP